MTMSRDPWSNERLEAAFTARSRQHGTPAGLTVDTLVAVRHAGAPPARSRPWGTLVPLAAALGLLAVVLGGPLLAGSPPTTTDPSVSPSPAASDVGETVFGLPVIDVRAAAAIRDAGVDERAIAVRGWLAFDGTECPAVDEGLVSPLQLGCEGQRRALLAEPDPALVGPGADPDPSVLLRPLLDWAPDVPPGEVAELVVVGHFDDRRAALCPPDEVQTCRDRFVVDRLVSVDGREVAELPMAEPDLPVQRSIEDIERALAGVVPDAMVLSAIPHGREALLRVEPGLDRPMLGGAEGVAMTFLPVWRVQALEAGRMATYLVADQWLDVSRIGADNRAELLAGGPRPSDDAWVWPRPDAHSTIRLHADPLAIDVALVDATGLLLEVQAADAGDAAARGPWVETAAGDEQAIVVGWTTSACEASQAVITVESRDSILLEQPSLVPADTVCDAVTADVAVVLRFTEPLDAASIDISDRIPQAAATVADPGLDWSRHALTGDIGLGLCQAIAFGDAFVGLARSEGADGSDRCGSVVVSSDGTNWRSVAADPFARFHARLHVAGERLIATGLWFDEGGERFQHSAWWSSDGGDWTLFEPPQGEDRFPTAATAVGDTVYATGERGIYRLDGSRWAPVADMLGRGGQLARTGPSGSVFLDVDDEVEPHERLWHSLDGWTWTMVELPSQGAAVTLDDLEVTSFASLAVGGIGAFKFERPAAWWSSDGLEWEEATVPQLASDERIGSMDIVAVRDGALAVGLAHAGATSRSLVWWTADGREWVEVHQTLDPVDPPTSSVGRDGIAYVFWPDHGWTAAPP